MQTRQIQLEQETGRNSAMMKRIIFKIRWELRNAWELMKFYDEVGK